MANTTDHPDITPDTHHIRNPEVIHEESDVSARGLFAFLGSLALGLLIACGVIYGLFHLLDAREQKAEKIPNSKLGNQDRLPPEPRLQLAPGHESHPLDDIKALHTEEQQKLNGYAWVNQSAGTVRIPIDQAMKIVAERYGKGAVTNPNAQASPQASPSPATGQTTPHTQASPANQQMFETRLPSDSSSGRRLEGNSP